MTVVVLGLILLLLGFLLGISLLYVLGVILLVVGIVLMFVGGPVGPFNGRWY